MANYTSATVAIRSLPSELIGHMASLYLSNYDGTSEDLFRQDLADKDEVLVLYADGELVGFTTLKIYSTSWGGRLVRIVYSGDTIVHRRHWGQQEMAFSWISRIGEIKAQAPAIPLYWFLLVKGHRTFKYLSVFGKSFYPHWKTDRSDLKPLADQLASARFADHYNPVGGIVEFPQSRGHLKPVIAEPTAEELTKEATQFFLTKNPGYRRGHELVCICELELANMKPLTARIFSRMLQAMSTV